MSGLAESGALKEDTEGKEAGNLAAAGISGRGSARYPEACQVPSVGAVVFSRREACLAVKDRGGGRAEVVCKPSAHPVPEGVEGVE